MRKNRNKIEMYELVNKYVLYFFTVLLFLLIASNVLNARMCVDFHFTFYLSPVGLLAGITIIIFIICP